MKREWTRLIVRMAASAAFLLPIWATGCAKPHDWWEFHVVQGVQVSLPPVTGKELLHSNRTGPAEPLRVRMGGDQTLLVGARMHDNPKKIDDEWSQTFVIVLDGPPKNGKYTVGPENGRFIWSTALVPARQPFVAADGWLRVISAERGGDVVTWCEVRNQSTRYGDQAYWMEGALRFKPTSESRLPGVVIEGTVAPKGKPAKQ